MAAYGSLVRGIVSQVARMKRKPPLCPGCVPAAPRGFAKHPRFLMDSDRAGLENQVPEEPAPTYLMAYEALRPGR